MTRRARRNDARERRVAVAVERERHDALHVAARGALVPRPACSRAIVHLAGLNRSLERLAIGVRDHEHVAGRAVLRDHGDEAGALLKIDRLEVERRMRHDASPAISVRASVASAALVATALPPNAVGTPSQLVNTPPASTMQHCRAAVSQCAAMASTITSARPVATSR